MLWAGVLLNTKTRAGVVNGNLNAVRYQNGIPTPVAIPHIQQNMHAIDKRHCYIANHIVLLNVTSNDKRLQSRDGLHLSANGSLTKIETYASIE